MLQIETVKPDCLALLEELMSLEELKSFRLAGGTALSLRLEHRISIDLDLFTNQLFDVQEFVTFFETNFGQRIKIFGSNRYSIFTAIDAIKVDFLYRYEKFIDKEDTFGNLRIASLRDIAAMKIHAAASRALRKDSYDLFELLNVYTFAELIDFHLTMYPNYDVWGILKSLSDFSEVDLDNDPESLRDINWDLVKEKIAMEIKNYVHSLQQKKSDAESERQKSIQNIISRKKNKN
jgi:hypothetical protein